MGEADCICNSMLMELQMATRVMAAQAAIDEKLAGKTWQQAGKS